MPWQLLVVEGADRGRFFVLPDEGTVTIGTNRKHADIAVNDLYVARIHCELVIAEGRVEVRTASAEHKFQIGNRTVTEGELPLGEVLRVGNTQFRLTPYDSDTTSGSTEEGEEEEVPEVEFVEDEEDAPGQQPATATKTVATPAPVATVPKPLPNLWLEDLPHLSGHMLSHYELGEVLGRGPCSVIFQAKDQKTGLTVAVRVFPPTFPANEGEMQRFVKALRYVLPLRHRHLVALWNAGRTVPYVWVAMDYVPGGSLANLLRELESPGKLSWKPALRIGIHIARALNYIHHHRLTHGNVTPSNILIREPDKVVKLGDLMLNKGLAGSVLEDGARARRMQAELPYLAPEQLGPEPTTSIRSDIYSLGAAMYGRITTKPPFLGDTEAETIEQIQTAPLPLVSQYGITIPDAFEEVLINTLSRRPEDRYETPADLLADLESIAETEGIEV
jgi:serine/threonine-protein kinase